MSGRISPVSSMASHDHFNLKPVKTDPQRQAQHAPQSQYPWYFSPFYTQYPAPAPHTANNPVLSPHPPTQRASAMPDWSGALDGEEQDRRRKGKEIVPFQPMMSGYRPQGFVYPGEYAAGSYRPLGGPFWSSQPPHQAVPLPSLPLPVEDHTAKTPGKHARYSNERKEFHRRHRSRSPQPGITVTRKVDGILTPDSGDLTVRLTMDVEEDLEHQLDEMSRLSRLGHFSEAKEFFGENLQRRIDNPYILVQYADLLLQQGDFKSVTLLQDSAIYKRDGDQSDSEALRILRVNWELLQVMAKSRTLDSLKGVYTIFKEAIDVLDMIAEDTLPDRPISSTEIQLLALTLRLTGDPMLNSRWLKYGGRALAAFPVNLMQLYQALLRHGRIWDLHDLIVHLPMMEDIKAFAHDTFGKDLVPSMQTMISDWLESVHGYDPSLTLGLLSIMTHILLEPVGASEKDCIEIFQLCLPIAQSIMENEPDSLKSRPYLRLLLAKSRFSETTSRKAMDSLKSHLRSSQGVFYQRDIALLPMYIPLENETPKWTPTDQPPELKDPAKLVLRSAIALGDFKTEVLARRELIRLSINPREDFDMLCALQLSRQGDLNGYGLTLASKILVSDTEVAKAELASAISRLLSTIVTTAYWGPSYEWVIHVLLHKLEKRSSATIQDLLGRSNVDYQKMEESLLREISKKMPDFQDWVDQQQEVTANPKRTKSKDTVLRAAPGSGSRRHDKRNVRVVVENQEGRQAPTRDSKQSRQDTIYEREEEEDANLMAKSKPGGDPRQHLGPDEDRGFSPPPPNAALRGAADRPRDNEETPVTSYRYPTERAREAQERQVLSSAAKPIVIDDPLNIVRQDQRALEAQLKELREKLDAGYSKILEAARESDRRQGNEMRAISEELKKEVEKIRKDTVEQVDRKNRVEAQERAEQKEWVRQQLNESNLEKAAAMERFEERTAELDAKFEITRKVAIEVAEKRAEMEYRIRTMKEDEIRKQEALELRKKMEEEIREQEEAKATKKMEEEIERRIEAERRERREAEKKEVEKKAMETAMKHVEEEKKRLWAVQEVKDDRNHIHLKDAVGRKLTIPFDQGRTWQGMAELIEAAFEKVDGVEPAVRAGRYDLLGPDDTCILPQTWEDTVQRGWSISMRLWPEDKPPRPAWRTPMPGSRLAPRSIPPYASRPPWQGIRPIGPQLMMAGDPMARPAPAPRPPGSMPSGAVIVEPSNKKKARKRRKQKEQEQQIDSSEAEAEAEDEEEEEEDNISSGYESSVGSQKKKKKLKLWRPREIFSNAFSSLQMTVLRRRHRRRRRRSRSRSRSRRDRSSSWSTTSSSGTGSVSSEELVE